MICEYRSKIYKLETAGNCILHKNSVQLQEKIFLAKDVNYIVPTSGSVLYQKGPFIYYVITILGFLDPPPPLRNHVFSTENNQNLAFSDPPLPYR